MPDLPPKLLFDLDAAAVDLIGRPYAECTADDLDRLRRLVADRRTGRLAALDQMEAEFAEGAAILRRRPGAAS